MNTVNKDIVNKDIVNEDIGNEDIINKDIIDKNTQNELIAELCKDKLFAKMNEWQHVINNNDSDSDSDDDNNNNDYDNLNTEMYLLYCLHNNNFPNYKDAFNRISCILTRLIIIKDTLCDNFYKQYLNYIDLSPLVMLATKNNFIKYAKYISETVSDNLINLLEIINNTYFTFDKIKPVYKIFHYIVTLYVGFIIYPDTKTNEFINTFYKFFTEYNAFMECQKHINKKVFKQIIDCFKTYSCPRKIIDINPIIISFSNSITHIKNDIHRLINNYIEREDYKSDLFSIITNNTYNLLNYSLEEFFLQEYFNTSLLNIACDNGDYNTISYLLKKNVFPTESNFNMLCKSIYARYIVTKPYTCYNFVEIVNYFITNLIRLIPKFYSYKISPNETFTEIFIYLLKKLDLTDDIIDNISKIANLLLNNNFKITNELILLLMLKKNDIFKNININEDTFFEIHNMYKNRHKLCVDNFNNPIHIMRIMAQTTTLTRFKNYIKKNNIKPDRYCFELAHYHNKPIEKWLFSNNCCPTIGIIKITKHHQNAEYYEKILNEIQTQEYMCKPYDLVI